MTTFPTLEGSGDGDVVARDAHESLEHGLGILAAGFGDDRRCVSPTSARVGATLHDDAGEGFAGRLCVRVGRDRFDAHLTASRQIAREQHF